MTDSGTNFKNSDLLAFILPFVKDGLPAEKNYGNLRAQGMQVTIKGLRKPSAWRRRSG